MQKFIFVYNANSGIVNTVLDVAHKIFSPKTYNCNLCALTFNTFSENKTWKDFRKQTNINLVFYHIDKFEKKYKPLEFIYPVIITQKNEDFEELLSAEKIKNLTSIEDLITIFQQELNQ